MTEQRVQGALDQKLAASRARPGNSAPQVLRAAAGRGLRAGAGLQTRAVAVTAQACSLAELLELLPDHALMITTESETESIGLALFDQALMAALIEAQTTGRVTGGPQDPRRPTRVDAALCLGAFDAVLAEFDAGVAQGADAGWAAGHRSASVIDTPAALGLMLEEAPYRLLTARLTLAETDREGRVMLCLPAQAPRPAGRAGASEAGLAAAIAPAHVTLDAVLHRRRMTLSELRALVPGDIVTMPRAALDEVALVGADGASVATGRMGQARGCRAIRLSLPEDTPAPEPAAEPAPGAPAALTADPDASADGADAAAAADTPETPRPRRQSRRRRTEPE